MEQEEKNKLVKEVFDLNDDQVLNLQRKKTTNDYNLQMAKFQKEELETVLNKGIRKKQTEEKITKIEELIKSKKDDNGKDFTEGDLEALKVSLSIAKKKFVAGMFDEELRINISNLDTNIKQLEQENKILAKQIRNRKIISIHR